MQKIDPWQVRSNSRQGRLWCYVYGNSLPGKPKVAGIPGLHLRLERRAAISLLLGLRRTHRLIHEESWSRKQYRLAGSLECAVLATGKAARQFSWTHGLRPFESVRMLVRDDDDRHIPKLEWSVAGRAVELRCNTKGLHELARAVLDSLFIWEDDYGVPARKSVGAANDRERSPVTRRSSIWVWGHFEEHVTVPGGMLLGAQQGRAKSQVRRRARTRRRL